MGWPRGRRGYAVGGIAAVLFVGVAVLLVSCSPTRNGSPRAGATARAATTAKGSTAEAPIPAEAYAGANACKECHESSFETFSKTHMGRLFLKHPRSPGESMGCESCHGPGKAHGDARGEIVGGLITFSKKDPTPVEQRNAKCLACHTKGARIFWEGSPHEASDVACTSCHTIMKETSPRNQLAKASVMDTCGTCHLRERAKQLRNSHMPLREGKMTCTSCHNPHGTVTPALLKENSLNDTCYSCHAEKRGPFLWEHPPVLESCANCHDPHGSNHEKMLKVAKPRLCQQCHNEQRVHPSTPYGRGNEFILGASGKFVFGRSCSNCHSSIHGSNHPSGAGFVR